MNQTKTKVTGDFHVTAAAIASQIGIFSASNNYDTLDTIKEHRRKKNHASSFALDMVQELEQEEEEAEEMQSHQQKTFFKRMLSHLPCFKRKITPPFKPNANYRSLLLTGADLEQLEEDEYNNNDSKLNDWSVINKYEEIVFARTTPTQKLKVVEEFKKRRNIVAVTGDGVNDSPALKAANIGIAMGGGSEVAMEAAQVVLLDNSFNSMVVAIENGEINTIFKRIPFFLIFKK